MSFLRNSDAFESIRQAISNQILGSNVNIAFLDKVKDPKYFMNLLTLRGVAFKKKDEEKVRHFLADLFAGEIVQIADNPVENDNLEDTKPDSRENVARSKLRIDTRKWLMEHFAPNFYGSSKFDKGDKVQKSLFRAKVYLPENGRP
ncbi:MAG: hypothetical protein V7740_09575 [Pseudomonas marincola]